MFICFIFRILYIYIFFLFHLCSPGRFLLVSRARRSSSRWGSPAAAFVPSTPVFRPLGWSPPPPPGPPKQRPGSILGALAGERRLPTSGQGGAGAPLAGRASRHRPSSRGAGNGVAPPLEPQKVNTSEVRSGQVRSLRSEVFLFYFPTPAPGNCRPAAWLVARVGGRDNFRP